MQKMSFGALIKATLDLSRLPTNFSPQDGLSLKAVQLSPTPHNPEGSRSLAAVTRSVGKEEEGYRE